MKLRNRLFILLAVAVFVMLPVLMTSCNNKLPVQDNVPFEFPYKEHVELTWWHGYADTAYYGDAFTKLEDHPFMKRLAEKTNVSVSFVVPTGAHIGENASQLTSMIAAGDMTDMVTQDYYGISFEGPTIDSAIDEEIYLELTDYVNIQMTNFNAIRSEYGLVDKILYTPNGNILYIPMLSGLLNYPNATKTSGLVVRQDFLDELQLDVPVTIDDWHEVLTSFKLRLGVETPMAVGIMIFAPSMDNDTFITCYGQRFEWYLKENPNGSKEVRYGAIDDGMYNYIVMMRQWFAEGLIAQVDAKEELCLSDDLGAWVGNVDNIMYYPDRALNADYKLTACPDPVVNVGDKITTRAGGASMIGDTTSNSIYLSYSCSQPAIAAKWIDQFFSEENFMEASYGIEGEDYTVDADGNIKFTDKIINTEGGVRYGIVQNCYLDSWWREPDLIAKYAYTDEARAATEVWSQATGENTLPGGGFLKFTPEEAEAVDKLNDNNFFSTNMSLKGFMSGERDLSEWDEFVAEMRDKGIEELMEYEQIAYDRFLAG